MGKIPDDLREALQLLDDLGIEDTGIYDLKEREGEGWHGPKVTAYAQAWETIHKYLAPEPS